MEDECSLSTLSGVLGSAYLTRSVVGRPYLGSAGYFFIRLAQDSCTIAILIHISLRLPERGLIGHNFNWLLGQSVLLPIGY
jgi:hypothetical protein